MITLSIVSVIELCNDFITGMWSFDDDAEGNRCAEELFAAMVEDCDASISLHDIDNVVEDGVYECGDVTLFITHSILKSEHVTC